MGTHKNVTKTYPSTRDLSTHWYVALGRRIIPNFINIVGCDNSVTIPADFSLMVVVTNLLFLSISPLLIVSSLPGSLGRSKSQGHAFLSFLMSSLALYPRSFSLVLSLTHTHIRNAYSSLLVYEESCQSRRVRRLGNEKFMVTFNQRESKFEKSSRNLKNFEFKFLTLVLESKYTQRSFRLRVNT